MDVADIAAWTVLVSAITGGVGACLKYGIQLAKLVQTNAELIATILERVHELERKDRLEY